MLTPTQTKYLMALFETPSQQLAAKKAGISEKTAYNYRKLPEFAAEYNRMSGEMIQETVRRLQRLARGSTTVLSSIIFDADARNSDRVAAIRTALEYCARFTEDYGIMERLEALERARDT